MNFIKNISLKYKPLIIFVILAVINAGGIYVLKQFAVDEIVEDALPTQETAGEFGFLSKEIQAEVLEYVNTGEQETVEEFVETAAKLTALSRQLIGLADDDGEKEIMVANEASALNLISVGEALLINHGESLDLIEAFKEAEQEIETAVNLIDRAALAAESGLTADLILRLLAQIEQVQTETLDYLVTGQDESLEEVSNERAEYLTDLGALKTVLAVDSSNQTARFQSILDSAEQISLLSEQIVTNHSETLELLEEIEELEIQAAAARITLIELINNDVSTILQTANRTVWISGLVVQLIFVLVGLVLARTIVKPILILSEAAQKLRKGDFASRVEVTSRDEIGNLMYSLNDLAAFIEHSVADLQQQSQAIVTSSEVSRRLSTILDPAELATAVVELLQVAFKFYHAHIYLYDEAREYLVMAGGTGEAGRAMLANKHRIETGKGLVGRTAETKEPTLVPDITADPDWLPNPLLPETKAEIAVPITLEDEVLGVLDIQQNIAGSLDQADVTLLTSIANQVAIGLRNARQYQQLQESEARTKAVLDSINVPITITRVSDGSFMYFNAPSLEASGINPDNITGRKAGFFYEEESPGRQNFVGMLREQGRVENLEMTLKRVTGEPYRVSMSARIINFRGERAVMSSFIDITEHHNTREASIKRAKEMETVAELGTTSATILDPDRLLKELVNLIKARFDLYHAHIHLLNENKDTMELTAGAGEIGQKMVAEGRRIPLASEGSLVATVARTKRGGIRNYDPPGEGFMPHPLLSETRSEMAVPISVGEEVLGVLDIRSDELNYFTPDDMQTYTIMAAQIAVALENARSYTRSEEVVRELQELSRRLTREGWDDFFEQQLEDLAFSYGLDQVSGATDSGEATAVVPDKQTMLTQSLQVQGESIGELLLASSTLAEEEASEIVTAVAERLSSHLENLRLTQQAQKALNETQRRTEELAVLNEMSQSLTAQTSVDGVFQTVYDFLSQLMDTTDFFTALYDEETDEVEFVLTALGQELHWHTERRPAGQGVTEYVIRQRQPLLMSENVERHLAEIDVTGYGDIPESWLGVPIMLGNRVLGVIGVESYTTPRLYTEQQLNLLTAVANQAAIAIESARLLEGTVALAEEEQILRQITTRVSTAIDTESILRTAAEEIGRALGLEGYVSLETVGSNGTNGHEPIVQSPDKAIAN